MPTDRLATTRTMAGRAAVGVFVGLAAGWYVEPAAQPAPPSPRLYVFDCGYLFNVNPETFNLTRQDAPDPAPVSCYLVVHPKGTLIFDTGLGDKLVGRPPYLTKRGTMSQVVLGCPQSGGPSE